MVKIACLEKIWFSRYLGPSHGPGRSRAFSNAKISGTKRTNRNLIEFSDITKTVLSKCLILGSFWSKLNVRKHSSSGVMAKNVNFEKSAKNGTNRAFSCFFSNSDHAFIPVFYVKLEAYRMLIWV